MLPFQQHARVIGDMPFFAEVAYAAWGRGCDFDSDGDCDPASPGSWRELQARLRPDLKEEIDIYLPTDDRDLILIQATEESLLEKAIHYLVNAGSIQLVDAPA